MITFDKLVWIIRSRNSYSILIYFFEIDSMRSYKCEYFMVLIELCNLLHKVERSFLTYPNNFQIICSGSEKLWTPKYPLATTDVHKVPIVKSRQLTKDGAAKTTIELTLDLEVNTNLLFKNLFHIVNNFDPRIESRICPLKFFFKFLSRAPKLVESQVMLFPWFVQTRNLKSTSCWSVWAIRSLQTLRSNSDWPMGQGRARKSPIFSRQILL